MEQLNNIQKIKNKFILSIVSIVIFLIVGKNALANELIFQDKNIINNKQVNLTQNIATLNQASIVVEFTSDNKNNIQSLVSFSNSKSINEFLNVYINNSGLLGMEILNGKKKISIQKPASLRGMYKNKQANNTIVVTIDKENHTYKIYSNGFLQLEEKINDFISIEDLKNKDTMYIGGVKGNNIRMPFSGTIHNVKIYNGILSDKEAKEITSKTSYGKVIFGSSDIFKSNYYRIPTLITLKDGSLLSSIDARKGGTHDARSNIDIGVARSIDNGESWIDKTYALHFSDYKDQILKWPRDDKGKNIQISSSASFIDSVLLEERESGRVFLFADAMPFGIGFNNAVRNSGFKIIKGKKYLKLKKDGENSFNYSLREDNYIYNDTNNQRTNYSLDNNYNILENNKNLEVDVNEVVVAGNNIKEKKTTDKTLMNIFYKDSIFKVERTNYLVYTYSDDKGKTWNNFKILPPFGDVNESVPLYGPGRGIQLKNGDKKGRLLLSMYSSRTGEFGFMYSDDKGKTWNYKKVDLGRAGATAEAQTIEFSNGDLRTFFRTSIGKIGYVTSKDGGLNWDNVRYLEGVNVTGYGTQLSAISYSKTIGGKDVVIMSYPESKNGRKDGSIKIGFSDINDPNHNISWDFNNKIDNRNFGFSYSALTELSNGDIGIYYEKWDSWSRNELHLNNSMFFEKYSLEELINKN